MSSAISTEVSAEADAQKVNTNLRSQDTKPAIQIAVCIPLFLLFSLVIEKTLSAEDRKSLYRKAESEFS